LQTNRLLRRHCMRTNGASALQLQWRHLWLRAVHIRLRGKMYLQRDEKVRSAVKSKHRWRWKQSHFRRRWRWGCVQWPASTPQAFWLVVRLFMCSSLLLMLIVRYLFIVGDCVVVSKVRFDLLSSHTHTHILYFPLSFSLSPVNAFTRV
jgi:hypothetical protein